MSWIDTIINNKISVQKDWWKFRPTGTFVKEKELLDLEYYQAGEPIEKYSLWGGTLKEG